MSVTVSSLQGVATAPVLVDDASVSIRHNDLTHVDFDEARNLRTSFGIKLVADAETRLEQIRYKNGGPSKKSGALRLLANQRTEGFLVNPLLIQIKQDYVCRNMSDPENVDKVDELARSIASSGLNEALTVHVDGDDIFLVHGYLRLLAVFRAIETYNAPIKAVLVIQDRLSKLEQRVLRQLKDAKPHTVIERGQGYVTLTRLGWTATQIAEEIGLTAVRVQQVIDLMQYTTEEIRTRIASGEIASTLVSDLLRENQYNTAKTAAIIDASVAHAVQNGRTKATRRNVDAVRTEVEHKLSAKAKLSVVTEALQAVVTNVVGENVQVEIAADKWAKIVEVLGL